MVDHLLHLPAACFYHLQNIFSSLNLHNPTKDKRTILCFFFIYRGQISDLLCVFVFVSVCLLPCGRPVPKASSEQGSSSDKKERPMSTMSEASNYTGGSDYSTFPGSPAITVTTATATSTSSTRVSVIQTFLKSLTNFQWVGLITVLEQCLS